MRTPRIALAAAVACGALMVAATAAKTINFSVKDVKGQAVSAAKLRGGVVAVFACDTLACKDLKKAIDAVDAKYGANKDFHWVGVAKMPKGIPDFGPARPMAEKGVATIFKKFGKQIDKAIKRDPNRNPYHFVIDWDKKLLAAVQLNKMGKKVRIAVIDKEGHLVGKFDDSQMSDVLKAVDGALGGEKSDDKKPAKAKK